MIAKWLQIDKIKFANCRGRRPRRPVHTQTNIPTNQNLNTNQIINCVAQKMT